MAGEPSDSWWICQPCEFAARVKSEQHRMQTSRFGKMSQLSPGPLMHMHRLTRGQKARAEARVDEA